MSPQNWRNSKVFITGSTGLLGSHLTQMLLSRGAEVVALVRDSVPKSLFFDPSSHWNLQNRVSIVRGDLTDLNLIERTLNEYEVDTVFHLAAQTIVGHANRSPIATFKSNIEGTWNVLEACRRLPKLVKRVLIASSDKAYGNLKGESYDENTPLNGEHPYDVSKSCADLISRTYFVSYGVPVCITRCGNFFGPGDLNFNRIIPGAIRDALNEKSPVIRSDGNFIRDYIYAPDGAHAYLTLAEAMATNPKIIGEAFNFSYGLKLSVKDLTHKVLAIMGKSHLGLDIRNEAFNEIPVQALNSEKAKSVLGWKAQYGFEEGLKLTIEWYTKLLSQT